MSLFQKNNLLLKIFFAFLIICLIGEIIYIFYTSQANSSISSQSNNKNVVKISPTIKYLQKVNTTYEGIINKMNVIKPSPNDNNLNSVELSFTIDSAGVNKKDTNTFFFKQSEMSFLRVLDHLDNLVDYKDLKVGQQIKISFNNKSEATSTPNIEIKIIK